MKEETKRKIAQIDALAEGDALYQYMVNNLKLLDEELEEATKRLSNRSRDKMWDYIMLCEDISRRKLELACEAMEFPEKQ